VSQAPRRLPRILFLVQSYPPAFGGGGLHLAWVRQAITRLGFSSRVITGNRGLTDSEPDVLRLPTPGGESYPRLGSYVFALLSPIALWLQRQHYDVIQTMGSAHYVYGGIVAGRLLGKPVVVSSVMNRGDDPQGLLEQRFGRLKNLVFSLAARFICCSGLQLESYREARYPEARVLFIPNGADADRFFPSPSGEARRSLRQELGIHPEEFVAVCVGAIIDRKGIDLLIDAWIRFRGRHDRGTLILVGPDRSSDQGSGVDDRFVQEMRDRLATAGLSATVRFTGKVSNVADYFRAGDVFVLMSRGEGFPIAILEALISGLPVLLWDLPDYRGYDLVHEVQGYLLPPFDVQRLADTLARLADDPAGRRRMGEQARRLGTQFTLERSMAEYAEVYRGLARP
jgi:glycosyltransferase involved in cell wall biosynthesis